MSTRLPLAAFVAFLAIIAAIALDAGGQTRQPLGAWQAASAPGATPTVPPPGPWTIVPRPEDYPPQWPVREPPTREFQQGTPESERIQLAEWLRTVSQGDEMADEGAAGTRSAPRGFDPAVVAAGRAAFENSCLDCHDAERALNKRSDLDGWLSTVRRMAAKEDANVDRSDFVPIATYLASLNPAAAATAEPGAATAASAAEAPAQELDLFATVSLNHRSGVNDVLQNPGFFPEVWAGAEWRTNSPLSARAQACVSCHSEPVGGGSRLELAEGFVRLDVRQWLDPCDRDHAVSVTVDGGRFIVPFGAFAARSHPGAYRTATRPLMYNMGQNVHRPDIGAPILPMPYSDEGVLISSRAELWGEVSAAGDFYAVNGLQGFNTVDFLQSRDYVDNNAEPAIGGRLTIGSSLLRIGASGMTGRYNSEAGTGPFAEGFYYHLYGVDLTSRIKDFIRLYAEYAVRSSDVTDFFSGVSREELRGLLLEGEVRLWRKPRISAVVRYDEQRRISDIGVPGSFPSLDTFDVNRFTWGFNFAIASSTLMINHERWNVPPPLKGVDVLAIRWVAAF